MINSSEKFKKFIKASLKLKGEIRDICPFSNTLFPISQHSRHYYVLSSEKEIFKTCHADVSHMPEAERSSGMNTF